MFWLFLLSTLFFDLLGMALARKYVLESENFLFWLSLLCFLCMGFFFLQVVRYEGMAIANILWTTLSVLGSTAIGFLYFQEKITSLQTIGIFICLLGIVLIQWPHK